MSGLRRADGLVAAALVLALGATALLLTRFPTWPWPGGDARDYANISEALARSGSFDLRHASRPTRRADDKTVIVAEDGAIYSIFPVGLPLVQLPAFALGRAVSQPLDAADARLLVETLAFGVTPALLYGLTAAVLYLLLRRYFGHPVGWALFGVALYAGATVAFSFSKHNGVEPLQAFLLAWLVYVLLVPGRASSPIAAFSYGLLVVTKPTSAVVLPVAAYLYLKGRVWQRSPWPSRLLAVAIGLGFAAFFFWYNGMRGGSPLNAYPTAKEIGEFGLGKIGPTVWPVLFGPDRNVFLNNPVFFLALPGFFLLRDRRYLAATLGCWTMFLLMYGSSGHYFWGSYLGNTRYLVPLGFLLIPYALASICWVAGLRSGALRAALAAVVLAVVGSSFYVQLLYASFSEFHVKQYERAYNQVVRQDVGERLGIEELEESVHQLHFMHHLFWLTSGSRPETLEAFPYPSHDERTAAFAAAFLREMFSERWFRKDYLFLNGSAFPNARFFPALRAGLALAALAGLCALAWAARRARAAERATPPSD